MDTAAPTEAGRIEQILDLFAREARIDRDQLRLDARADELGIGSLDLMLALFELEERFGVEIAQPPPGQPLPTLCEVVQQVLAGIDARCAQPAGR